MSLIPVILPTTVAAPTFASILTSQDTYLNSLTPLSVVGSGGGGGGSGPNIECSTIVCNINGNNSSVFQAFNGVVASYGADLQFNANGITAYQPKIEFNYGSSGTATIRANTPGAPNGIVIQSTLTTSAFSVSSINNAPALTLAQYQYLSSIVP